MSEINRHWADTLPTEILKDTKKLDFLIRLNGQKHNANEREATAIRMVEH